LLASQRELNESRIRLQYLSSNLLNAQENERKRIARELHDELGASMAVLKMQVRSAEKSLGPQIPEQLRDECDKLRASINQIIENVRRLSRDLSPVVLEDLGLEAAIEHLIDTFAELNKLTIKSDLSGILFLVKEETQRNVYRILQELLNNIRKHAAAKNIVVAVKKVGAELKFSVGDDGVGLDVDEVHRNFAKEGMGLTTIAERVRILGGTMTIDSKPGQGCLVEFTAPI
jgi:signal transduction histidine kinase